MSRDRLLTSNEDQRALIEGAVKAFNAHDLERWMNFYAEDALHYQPGLEEPLRGRTAIREDYLRSTWVPFPDFHFELERAFGEGAWICVEGLFTGTHEGPLEDPGSEAIAPTHRSIRVPLCLVLKLIDGKAVQVHEYNDRLTLFSQLGLAT